jgi:predicted alpha-1,2-mannosidase
MTYLYDWSGEPWKAQARVREVMRKLYSATPDGYCGDEDNGQTSAWYVFSAMGFYPVCPGSGEYAIGSPLFRKITVRPGSGRSKFEISTNGGGLDAPYIAEMSLNGKAYSKNFVTHEDLMGGAKLDYKMSSEPNTSRGTDNADLPYSFSRY